MSDLIPEVVKYKCPHCNEPLDGLSYTIWKLKSDKNQAERLYQTRIRLNKELGYTKSGYNCGNRRKKLFGIF